MLLFVENRSEQQLLVRWFYLEVVTVEILGVTTTSIPWVKLTSRKYKETFPALITSVACTPYGFFLREVLFSLKIGFGDRLAVPIAVDTERCFPKKREDGGFC